MNSKQRRHKRVYEHTVVLVCRDSERYFEFERRVVNASGWLQWQTKKKNWICSDKTFNSATFNFRAGGIASAFALKWS